MSTTTSMFDVCSLEELKAAGAKAFDFRHPEFGLHEIAVFWDGSTVYGLENLCPHLFASLANGPIERGRVTCPSHGAIFDLATGACLDRFTIDTQAYQTKVENGRVYIIAPGETRA
ncbi:MAG: Rieske 2Fe-2S domain-containing protein [SAR202 cluster bacterium]|nr:Rieske 2Fe-2S domain-containing protein [SAR202 cluster bacterium]